MKLKIVIDGKTYEAEVQEAEEPRELGSHDVSTIQSAVLPTAKVTASSDFDERKVCRTPLAGVVARVAVRPGQHVQANELLLVLEAMKMEIKITAESAATVKSVAVESGAAVRPNQILFFFE
jgi:methylmalonyl-CoA carboxyltransferase 1.3S subunit